MVIRVCVERNTSAVTAPDGETRGPGLDSNMPLCHPLGNLFSARCLCLVEETINVFSSFCSVSNDPPTHSPTHKHTDRPTDRPIGSLPVYSIKIKYLIRCSTKIRKNMSAHNAFAELQKQAWPLLSVSKTTTSAL